MPSMHVGADEAQDGCKLGTRNQLAEHACKCIWMAYLKMSITLGHNVNAEHACKSLPPLAHALCLLSWLKHVQF